MAKQPPLCGGIIRAPRYFWVYAFVLQLTYGFFKELKPAEAYITAFLTNATDGKNISVDVVNNKINPYWTYSYLVTSFVIFLLTDLLRYNPVIIIECSAYLSRNASLLHRIRIRYEASYKILYVVVSKNC